MSRIPNEAMPHATVAALENEEVEGGETLTLKERAGRFATGAADLARDNPKTAIAAGAALFAGAVVAAAIPTARARSRKSGGTGASAGGASRKKKS